MPSCPEGIVYPYIKDVNLISMNINANVGSSTTQTTKVNTNPITFKSKEIKYKWMKINKGCNDAKSKHWPKTCNLVEKHITKKIKFCGFSRKISIPYWLPTKCNDEVYTTHEKFPSYNVYTLPSFKFDFIFKFSCNFDIQSTFEIDSEGMTQAMIADPSTVPSGGRLQLTTQEQINLLYALSDSGTIGNMSTEQRVAFLKAKVKEKGAEKIIPYLLNDSITYKYTITSLISSCKMDVETFELSFGDLYIKIPRFQINITIGNIMATNPITVTYDKDGKFTAQILVYSTKNTDLDFFILLINSITATIEQYTDDPETTYDIKELTHVLNILQDGQNSITVWLNNNLALTYEVNIYLFLCLAKATISDAGKAPASAFSIKSEFKLKYNPFKILETLLDVTKELQAIMVNVEDALLEEIKDIPGSFSHTLDSLLDSSLKQYNKVIKKGLDAAEKDIKNKYLDKLFDMTTILYVPIDPS
jgi:hypothetical protein